MDSGSGRHQFGQKRRSMVKLARSCTMTLAALVAIEVHAQVSTTQENPSNAVRSTASVQHVVALSVPSGTPLQVALDGEVRVKGVGQRVQGHLMQPVYAFDQL